MKNTKKEEGFTRVRFKGLLFILCFLHAEDQGKQTIDLDSLPIGRHILSHFIIAPDTG
jgi:hypothetical protein